MDDIITERLSKSSFLIPEGFHSIEELDDIIWEGDSITIPQYIDLLERLYEELTMTRSSQSVEEMPEFRYYTAKLNEQLYVDFHANDYDWENFDLSDINTTLDINTLNFIMFITYTYGTRRDEDVDTAYEYRISTSQSWLVRTSAC